MHTFGYKNSVVYRPLHCESRPEIVRYGMEFHTCRRENPKSSYLQTCKFILQNIQNILVNMKVHKAGLITFP